MRKRQLLLSVHISAHAFVAASVNFVQTRQGVYKAILVDRLGWELALSRYVHLNPVRTVALGLSKTDQKADRLGVRGEPQRKLIADRLEKLSSYRCRPRQICRPGHPRHARAA